MKRMMLIIAMTVAVAFGAETQSNTFDKYFKEAASRCGSSYKGSFLCDAVKTYETMEIRGVSVDTDPYARMILCSSFALATKFERYDVYEGVDVALTYKSNGEIAWVLLTRLKSKCGNIAKDIMKEGYLGKR